MSGGPAARRRRAAAPSPALPVSSEARPVGAPATGPLRALVRGGGVDTVLLAAVDWQGRLKGKEFDAGVLLDRLGSGRLAPEMCGYVFDTDLGMSADGSGALGSWGTGFSDVALAADLADARLLPWLPATALVPCRPVSGGEPLPVAPDTLLDDQLTLLAEHGLSVQVGVETEFVLYEGSVRDAAGRDFRRLRPATWDNRDYALDQPRTVADFTRSLRRALAGAGLPVEAVKLEGAPGQVEVTFPYGDPRLACLQHVLFKHAVRAVADRHGLAPTFMASPATGTGSGMHLHVSLYGADGPVLGGPGGTALSDLGEQAVAGLLEVLPVTAPLYAPYVNSYRRFRDHSFAPTRFTWGRDNRACAVRVVGHGAGLHLEIRLPGADANPYAALAAVLAGVRHGIGNGLKAPRASEGDAYLDTGAARIPSHLVEAVGSFERSELAAGLLGDRQVAHLAGLARLDLDHHNGVVTDAEVRRGFAQA
ncbi:glutamine synthetase family protein [Streptomyces sp. BE303]|uniref:glutamine synthetase family protein n=1 Tax=Streptomyces sp. BE303 TaxID=3002528 RepID=UPI002E79EA4E|nr:glutamine synthetase family protein [Streptomyces sp. BE303]MED7953134.1 glutamine synthetase family protein [Streptomyces sp. BE303]